MMRIIHRSLTTAAIFFVLVVFTQVAFAADGKPLTVVTFGDSTTAPRGKLVTYTDLLKQELPKRGFAPEVFNAGVGGNTTEKARPRFERDVLDRKPDVAVIQFGINDAAVDLWKEPPATESRVDLATYEANLRYFVKALRERGAKVVLMTSNGLTWTKPLLEKYGKPPYDAADPLGFNVVLRKYVAVVRRVASEERTGLVDVFALYEAKGAASSEWLLDGMHPNDVGQKLVFDKLLPEIERLTISPRR